MLDAAFVAVHAIGRAIPGRFQESPAIEPSLVIVSFVTTRFAIDIHLTPANLFDLIALQLFRVTAAQRQNTIMAVTPLAPSDGRRAKVLGGVIVGGAKTGSAMNVIIYDDDGAPKQGLTALLASKYERLMIPATAA
ncbi:hypothetical protein [Nereida sp. MMG025]|uniref:hypothetical protein n=1 Tax=Nereida sp. MMG025 TaxID=2909981 RepID=UPI001F4246F3|nr:hypothetical protein [Nereida sp. MMG025]MCF6443140.1 hypothetical protein [Nereida sp. MMG025]